MYLLKEVHSVSQNGTGYTARWSSSGVPSAFRAFRHCEPSSLCSQTRIATIDFWRSSGATPDSEISKFELSELCASLSDSKSLSGCSGAGCPAASTRSSHDMRTCSSNYRHSEAGEGAYDGSDATSDSA
ncbi:hypothetical protein CAOG_009793 [Capsaspora owczarzaki ATCC 30864]|uniref:Uncharacterized protein n=1 Tax=Capsaspora owczarzaki (strain ATCC 30864) TaxID=595528 RepID=A0A0D2WQT3_CAPO3|nr:hypothetical protein CAOG_009793 [Capsaspora owczarzaki ATCC 30864]